jgi:hypothetical protein
MNDDTKDLLVNALAFVSTTIITVLGFVFVVFMVKVGVRLTTFAWELI